MRKAVAPVAPLAPAFGAGVICTLVLLPLLLPSAAMAAGLSAAQVAPGNGYTCAVRQDATVMCWGLQPFLRFGAKPELAQPKPILIDGGQADIRQVSLGLHHACALTTAGTVACWGSDYSGQLGAAPGTVRARRLDRQASAEPLVVPGVSGIGSIAAGGFHTCAVTEKGGVICWGGNRVRQLGSDSDTIGPVSVAGLETGVQAVSAGLLHTCALLVDGRVKCWGDGSAGQLGIGSTPDKPQATPRLVADLRGKAIGLSSGRYHTCATLETGDIFCWGSNKFGQIGDGTQTDRPSPVRVAGLPGKAVAVAAGAGFTCARLAEGPPVCWGWNDYGQLASSGDAPGMADEHGFTVQLSPRPVIDIDGGLQELASGEGHSCALTSDGEVKCWGMNNDSQLGDGTLWDWGKPISPILASDAGPVAVAPDLTPSEAAQQDAGGSATSDPSTELSLSGIDVSYYSGRIDWSEFQATHYDFAFIRATVGLDYKDPLFEYHWDRTKQLGLRPGAYHYFVPQDDPAAQAQWFIDNVGLSQGDLVPAVDVESLGKDPPRDLSERLKVFLQLLQAHYGVPPIIYTAPNFWDRNMTDQFGAYPLWVADYDTDEPRLPNGWSSWNLWQWKGSAELPGISKIVDLNRFHGTQAEWQVLEMGDPGPSASN